MYKVGCTHASMGCTDNTFNGHFIGKWKDKSTDEIYIGMPQFDTPEEWIEKANSIEIIKWICPNNGLHCSSGHYPKSTHPQNYYECELKEVTHS